MMSVDTGIILSTIGPIYGNVLRHLNFGDLYVCAKVCKSWAAEVRKIRIKRDLPSVTYLEEKELPVHILSITAMMTDQLPNSAELLVLVAPRKSVSTESYTSGLPKNSALLLATTDGQVATRSRCTQIAEREQGDDVVYAQLYFPVVKDSYFHLLYKVKTLATDLSQLEDLKCCLILGSDKGMRSYTSQQKICEALSKLPNWQANSLAIGGGVAETVSQTTAKDKTLKRCDFAILAFYGPRIDAASILLLPDVKEEIEIIAQLEKLRSGLEMGCYRRTIGFMFACVARGEVFYGKECVESSLFKRVFPDTQLIGFFGNGEIGVECLPKLAGRKRVELPCDVKQVKRLLFRGYSTVFAVVGFK